MEKILSGRRELKEGRDRETWDGSDLGIQRAIQQHIAGFQVQVQHGGVETVEEVHTQSHLVSQSEGQWPGQGLL